MADANIVLTKNNDGTFGWSVVGKNIKAGGSKSATSYKDAESQAKCFMMAMVKAEKFCLETDTVNVQRR